jgi:tetratricopeptide (TPR) repeat protein
MRNVLWGALAAFNIVGASAMQWQLAAVPPPNLDVNLFFVPPAQAVKSTATGYENLIADALWLQLLQYYGERLVHENQRAVNLPAMFDLITDLDPRFWFAYWLGAWAMSDNNEGDQAIALLQKGERLNPDDYNFPFLQGYVNFLVRKDYPNAASAFNRAATKPGAPRFAHTLAARMLQKTGRDEQALAIWVQLARTAPDKNTRRIAERNIARVKAEMAGRKPRAYPVGIPKPGEPL